MRPHTLSLSLSASKVINSSFKALGAKRQMYNSEKLIDLHAAVISVTWVTSPAIFITWTVWVCVCVCVLLRMSITSTSIKPTPEEAKEPYYTPTRAVYIMLFAATTTSHFQNFQHYKCSPLRTFTTSTKSIIYYRTQKVWVVKYLYIHVHKNNITHAHLSITPNTSDFSF